MKEYERKVEIHKLKPRGLLQVVFGRMSIFLPLQPRAATLLAAFAVALRGGVVTAGCLVVVISMVGLG